jgi:hypothetical protein
VPSLFFVVKRYIRAVCVFGCIAFYQRLSAIIIASLAFGVAPSFVVSSSILSSGFAILVTARGNIAASILCCLGIPMDLIERCARVYFLQLGRQLFTSKLAREPRKNKDE